MKARKIGKKVKVTRAIKKISIRLIQDDNTNGSTLSYFKFFGADAKIKSLLGLDKKSEVVVLDNRTNRNKLYVAMAAITGYSFVFLPHVYGYRPDVEVMFKYEYEQIKKNRYQQPKIFSLAHVENKTRALRAMME